MKILIAAIGVPGHLNPLLGVARVLVKHGHEVLVQTGSACRSMVEAAALPFVPLLPEADIEVEEFLTKHPERKDRTPGIEMFGFDVEHFFLPNLAPQAAGLELTLRDFPADAILADSFFFGTLPLLLGPRQERPVIVHVGISVLNFGSGTNMPPIPAISAEESMILHQERERVLLTPLQSAFNKALASLGCGALPCPALESTATLSDLYLHPSVESFQYNARISSKVHYIGQIPLPPQQHALPDWWDELDTAKRLVLVTQGTVANWDFGHLVGPALTALAEEEDVTILVTTGGKPAESIPVPIPANARVTEFLPYDDILSRVDLLITNGGYGSVNLAIAHGVPIISAGLTEDKEEVSALVQWSGVGIDLRTSQASPKAVKKAARTIFDSPAYRNQAKKLEAEFASHDTETELLELLEAIVPVPTKG